VPIAFTNGVSNDAIRHPVSLIKRAGEIKVYCIKNNKHKTMLPYPVACISFGVWVYRHSPNSSQRKSNIRAWSSMEDHANHTPNNATISGSMKNKVLGRTEGLKVGGNTTRAKQRNHHNNQTYTSTTNKQKDKTHPSQPPRALTRSLLEEE